MSERQHSPMETEEDSPSSSSEEEARARQAVRDRLSGPTRAFVDWLLKMSALKSVRIRALTQHIRALRNLVQQKTDYIRRLEFLLAVHNLSDEEAARRGQTVAIVEEP